MIRNVAEFKQRYPDIFQLANGYLNQDFASSPEEAIKDDATSGDDGGALAGRQVRDVRQSFDDAEPEQIVDILMIGE